jgi:hypothetical protein
MVSAGKFGHHATIGLVHCCLGMQMLRKQLWPNGAFTRANQSHTRFIARRFNTQYQHGAEFSPA